jgi:hypothetical protein
MGETPHASSPYFNAGWVRWCHDKETTGMQLTFRSQATAGFALVGTAATAVAIMAAAFAPTARADDFSDIVTDLDAVLGAGSADLTAAAADFSAADYGDGLAATVFGLDDFLISPEEISLIGGFDALTGSPVLPADSIEWPGPTFVAPTDLIDTLQAAYNYADYGATDLTTAVTDLFSGDPADSLLNAVAGVDALLIGDPEVLSVGLTDTLLGGL